MLHPSLTIWAAQQTPAQKRRRPSRRGDEVFFSPTVPTQGRKQPLGTEEETEARPRAPGSRLQQPRQLVLERGAPDPKPAVVSARPRWPVSRVGSARPSSPLVPLPMLGLREGLLCTPHFHETQEIRWALRAGEGRPLYPVRWSPCSSQPETPSQTHAVLSTPHLGPRLMGTEHEPHTSQDGLRASAPVWGFTLLSPPRVSSPRCTERKGCVSSLGRRQPLL